MELTTLRLRFKRRRLRHCRCLRFGAPVKLLEPCTLMRHSGITLLSSFFVPLLVGSGFLPLVCITVTKSATTEDGTHDLKNKRFKRCRLRPCRCLRYGAPVKLLEPCTLMRHSGITLLSSFFVPLLVGSGFLPLVCITVTKSATTEDGTHDLKNMRFKRCRLRPCRCLRYGAPVKLLEPCTLMRLSGITLLSSCILCCFWLVLAFRLQYVLPWQKVRQLRMELATLRSWDLPAADCAIVAVSFMVHQWNYWSLVSWCGIPEWHCCLAVFCAAFGWFWLFASSMYYRDKKCDNWEWNSRP